ncbi:MAG: spermidine/putrescine ABC transporter substrate-binding protein [Acidimicrobiales bacterium]|jgi:spermidine/putrescine-binding protein|nr:polyamine ABC transporter substrate-binding protein [Acidimicrobiaceae bacterium]MDP6161213.1 spermidine/putrescine ABC transporter substrate-binding protein [Acidimicrobiales bacterium]MDP6285227.1 spermidine/putrescine ABC transporter substrate-binding protein [Acidimicrobiales bacterium]HJL91721.1 spermidine/putrescine ABC transporter substrate-binding protein [Acidimicrobiales bacterium]HJO40947.1 spermidine/putrescine ABC transporter substrate-binding protein [Acidimicrobiales bacterium|tara:strand:+ start:1192 stop:2298 length:1107 start_codon:yes stop_codon:yes gene_type:complete
MRNLKRFRYLAVLLALALAVSSCGSDSDEAAVADCELNQVDGDLALYNWAEYIDEEQLAEFATEYGISATMDVYDSNEAMQPIISAGNSGYDVIVPSDYMVSILIADKKVQKLNSDAIPNAENISADFSGLYYDPSGEYTVPYQWGTTGIGVNTAVVGKDFPRSWGLIFDPSISGAFDGKIQLLNDPRETMGAALKYLGYSLNTTDKGELDKAKDLVSSTADRLAAFNTDSADEFLTSGETVIGHGYSGDMFVQFLETDNPEDYVYFVPEEGGTRWIDNMGIPFDAPHPCTAHTFINWLLGGDQGAALSNWNYYGTPNDAAVAGLDEDLLDFVNDPELLAGGVDSLEEIEDTGDFEINYADAFVEAKG